MDHVKLVNDPIDIAHIHQLLADEGCGASSVFVGTTRDNFQGKKVASLSQSIDFIESFVLFDLSGAVIGVRGLR